MWPWYTSEFFPPLASAVASSINTSEPVPPSLPHYNMRWHASDHEHFLSFYMLFSSRHLSTGCSSNTVLAFLLLFLSNSTHGRGLPVSYLDFILFEAMSWLTLAFTAKTCGHELLLVTSVFQNRFHNALTCFKALNGFNGLAPVYLTECFSICTSARDPRAANVSLLKTPCVKYRRGERPPFCSYFVSKLWNLPPFSLLS